LSLLAGSFALPAAAADEDVADVCLEVAAGALTETEWAALETGITAAVASRPALFSEPLIAGDPLRRFDIWSGREGLAVSDGASCLEPGSEWTARFGRDFLQAGADQMLAEAPTTPGIGSEVTLEPYPRETRLRTTLDFAGPFGIPNGTCWVDDVLSVDASSGLVVASGEQGLETSPFAEGACGRFFSYLPDGGAGEQAVTLLPASVELSDGAVLRFVAHEVGVHDDAVTVAGRLQRD
jgi:hypothetical protein